jgi:hypothetical protein
VPPWVFFARNGVSIVLAPVWLLALPLIGAQGAWLADASVTCVMPRARRISSVAASGWRAWVSPDGAPSL